DLARPHVERERRVVVEVGVLVAGEQELGRRGADRSAHVDQVQLGLVAGVEPGADLHALFERGAAPGGIVGIVAAGDGAGAPNLAPGARVVRGDHAGVGSALGLAAAAGDRETVGDDGPGALLGALVVVHDRGVPRQLPGPRVDRVDVVVAAPRD